MCEYTGKEEGDGVINMEGRWSAEEGLGGKVVWVVNVKGELGGRWGSILGRRQGVSGKVDSTTTHP